MLATLIQCAEAHSLAYRRINRHSFRACTVRLQLEIGLVSTNEHQQKDRGHCCIRLSSTVSTWH